MIYYTQLLQVRPGHEQALRDFENATLPILARHEGRLLCQMLLEGDACLHNDSEYSELHLLSFTSKEHFAAYLADDERQQMLHMKQESVISVLLVEGSEVRL
jgi:hypothetical protein